MKPPFSDLLIDRFLAGELEDAERAAFEARCAAEPALQARVDELRASRRAFSTAAPSFEAVVARAQATPSLWQRLARSVQARVALGALATAGVLVLVTQQDAGTRTKGSRFVDFVVERDAAVQAGAPGMTLHANDRVQFSVQAGAGAFVGVWSLDGAGAVTPYAPSDGSLVSAQGAHRFAHSTRLDDVLGDEVFVGFRCTAPVERAVLAAAVKDGAAPEGCEVDRVPVRKAARP